MCFSIRLIASIGSRSKILFFPCYKTNPSITSRPYLLELVSPNALPNELEWFRRNYYVHGPGTQFV